MIFLFIKTHTVPTFCRQLRLFEICLLPFDFSNYSDIDTPTESRALIAENLEPNKLI